MRQQANVMLSYPLDEAIALLSKRLAGSRESLQATGEDLDFLRDQITTMEVNTARIHNWDVKRRRERCVVRAIEVPALLADRGLRSAR